MTEEQRRRHGAEGKPLEGQGELFDPDKELTPQEQAELSEQDRAEYQRRQEDKRREAGGGQATQQGAPGTSR